MLLLAGRSLYSESLITKGISLLGYDFRLNGPRYSYTNLFSDVAPGGTLTTGVTRRVTAGQQHIVDVSGARALDRWDLSGAAVTLAANASLTLTDCKLKPDISVAASFICIDVAQDNASVTGSYCDLDGGQFQATGQACMARVRTTVTGSSIAFDHSKVHGLGADGFNGGFLTLNYMWFYDSGYGNGAHSDFEQIIGGDNISVTNSLLDGTSNGQPVDVNNALRLVAESSGVIDGVTVTNCIIVNSSTAQPPIALGYRDDSPAGVSAVNFNIHGNWIRTNVAGPTYVYASYGPSGGTNRWYNNLDLDTLATISAPAIGTWLGAP